MCTVALRFRELPTELLHFHYFNTGTASVEEKAGLESIQMPRILARKF